MARGNTLVELDFLGIEKEIAASFRALDRRSPARGPPPQTTLQGHPSTNQERYRPRPLMAGGDSTPTCSDRHVLPLPVSVDDAGSESLLPAEVILKLAEDCNAGNGRRERSLDELNRGSHQKQNLL
ncbi:hypothetical protein BHE74_00047574 [Ensete ventricosum]|nr:hypothetical protein BHE74_00047574 [Ensete ventricosum]